MDWQKLLDAVEGEFTTALNTFKPKSEALLKDSVDYTRARAEEMKALAAAADPGFLKAADHAARRVKLHIAGNFVDEAQLTDDTVFETSISTVLKVSAVALSMLG